MQVQNHQLGSFNVDLLFALLIFYTYKECKAEERENTAVCRRVGVCGQNPTKVER